MRILVDLQAVQASNGKRGIGRYSASLLKAMVGASGKHVVEVLLNGSLGNVREVAENALGALASQVQLHVWDGMTEICGQSEQAKWRRRAAEVLREAFVAKINPDVHLLSSLFEGYETDAVSSIGMFAGNVATSVTHYDLIPLVHQEIYLGNAELRAWYENKLDQLRRADLCLCISDASRAELIERLEMPCENAVTTNGAADAMFVKRAWSSAENEGLRHKFGLSRDFIMYTGGIDHRKNLRGLVDAYSALDPTLRAEHQLAIICAASVAQQQDLRAFSVERGLRQDELVLTGFVQDEDLIWLYNTCKLFVFPSWHEGFGLPVLEAMQCGAPVIGSENSSIGEIIANSAATFDPRSRMAMAMKMTQALTDEGFRHSLISRGLTRAKDFSWGNCAKLAIDAFEQRFDRSVVAAKCRPPRRPRLAFVSPLPPQRTGIADYSSELLPGLSRHYDITVISDQDQTTSSFVQANCEVKSPTWFLDCGHTFERIYYQIGNSHFHQYMFELLAVHPGVVCLHDFYLSGAMLHEELRSSQSYAWGRAIYTSHGYQALRDRYTNPDAMCVMENYPANADVLRHALGIISHSRHSRDLAARWYGGAHGKGWYIVPMVRPIDHDADRQASRQHLGLLKEQFVACSFGIVASTKLSDIILEGWLQSELAAMKDCLLVFVGDDYGSEFGDTLRSAIRRSGCSSRIKVTGFLEDAEYKHWLAAADVGVQLRTRSRGENSRALLDCMSYGLPVVANRHGSAAEQWPIVPLPDVVNAEDVAQALTVLKRNDALRGHIGRRARGQIARVHQPMRVGTEHKHAIEKIYWDQQSGLGSVARALGSLSVEAGGHLNIGEVAERAAASLTGWRPVRQMFLDVTDDGDATNREVFLRLLSSQQDSAYRIEPIVFKEGRYWFARQWACRAIGVYEGVLHDDPIESAPGDAFLVLPSPKRHAAERLRCLSRLAQYGCDVFLSTDTKPQQGHLGLEELLLKLSQVSSGVAMTVATAIAPSAANRSAQSELFRADLLARAAV